jgi:hypothetical protein
MTLAILIPLMALRNATARAARLPTLFFWGPVVRAIQKISLACFIACADLQATVLQQLEDQGEDQAKDMYWIPVDDWSGKPEERKAFFPKLGVEDSALVSYGELSGLFGEEEVTLTILNTEGFIWVMPKWWEEGFNGLY